ncbi:MAG TPA: polyprenol phosphomannose-dependent alpha 1,6 mannosyltransferase MptB [Solirubrobacterales bacterium]|nr:polyprenol phosphomannose-dependent alpha 1,6 mannosyltransferase MptB [Solirubrobacterales bacterium]
MWAGFGAYLGLLTGAPRLGRGLVWGAILVLVAAFAAAPVLLSHDVYSYVDYARLGMRHGLDPYVQPPLSAPADPAYARVTWPDTTSAYGPLFTLLTYPLAWLPVGAAVAALKALAALSVLGTAALASRIAAWRGVEPLRAAVFVALNPIVLVHVVGGAHNDALMMLVATAAVAALLTHREASAGAALIAAAAIKLSAAFLAPFALLATGRNVAPRMPTGRKVQALESNRPVGGWGWTFRPVVRLLLGALAAALATGVAAYAAFRWEWLDALDVARENQNRTSHLSIPTTFARISGLSPHACRLAALALLVAFLIYLLVWTWRGGDWVRAAAWAALALLLATSWLLPWYLLWPLPLVAISRDRTLQLLTLSLTAYQLGARIPL